MIARSKKALASLAAGVAVFLAAGLITGKPAVWISTAIAAAGAGLATYAAPPNSDGAGRRRRPKPGP